MRISIVDDRLEDRNALQRELDSALREKGYSVETIDLYSSGEEFLSGFKKGKYDLIFFDIYMDGINGIEAIKEIRRSNDKLYTEFVSKAIELNVVKADNDLYYLEPLWKDILSKNQLYYKNVGDVRVDSNLIEDVLKLEVEKRNTINSKLPAVMNWLYELITAQIEPAMLEEEAQYIKQVTEFMKANHELQNGEDK